MNPSRLETITNAIDERMRSVNREIDHRLAWSSGQDVFSEEYEKRAKVKSQMSDQLKVNLDDDLGAMFNQNLISMDTALLVQILRVVDPKRNPSPKPPVVIATEPTDAADDPGE